MAGGRKLTEDQRISLGLLGRKEIVSRADLDKKDETGQTILMKAIEVRDEWKIFTLMELGVDFNLEDNDGNTAAIMIAAIKEEHPRIFNTAKLILRKDLEFMIRAGQEETVADLIARDKAGYINLNESTKFGVTFLMHAALGHFSIVNHLLSCRADPNRQDSLGRTALMLAAKQCDERVLEALIEAKADVDL
jgi:ankyrin repeat protein